MKDFSKNDKNAIRPSLPLPRVHCYQQSISSEENRKIQDGIIHQLTQAESIVKAIYERNLVEALLTHNISDPEFWRMNFILQHLYSLDIEDLIHLYNGGACTEEQKKNGKVWLSCCG